MPPKPTRTAAQKRADTAKKRMGAQIKEYKDAYLFEPGDSFTQKRFRINSHINNPSAKASRERSEAKEATRKNAARQTEFDFKLIPADRPAVESLTNESARTRREHEVRKAAGKNQGAFYNILLDSQGHARPPVEFLKEYFGREEKKKGRTLNSAELFAAELKRHKTHKIRDVRAALENVCAYAKAHGTIDIRPTTQTTQVMKTMGGLMKDKRFQERVVTRGMDSRALAYLELKVSPENIFAIEVEVKRNFFSQFPGKPSISAIIPQAVDTTARAIREIEKAQGGT